MTCYNNGNPIQSNSFTIYISWGYDCNIDKSLRLKYDITE